MLLTPSERDRLLLFTAAELARARRARGLRLNAPEATALIADAVCEAARSGARRADAVAAGHSVLGPDDVLPGVAGIVDEVHVEAVFDDGSRLAVISDPIGAAGDPDGPGAVQAADRELPRRDDVTTIPVTNTATVPISVTSHVHFFEVNARLRFDRAAGYGRRPYLPAGATLRLDPGQTRQIELVPIGGDRVVIGFAGLVDGPLDAPGAFEEAMRRAEACGYLSEESS
jgi:urease subunit gamma/beta